MSGRALYVKFVLLMVAAATISLALGTEPWGPNWTVAPRSTGGRGLVPSRAARVKSSSSFRGAPRSKEEQMSGRALYVKFVLLMVAAATLSLALGTEPWGPN